MAQLKIDLIVNDDGTATLKNFAGQGTEILNKLKSAGADLNAGFAKTWAGIAAGAAGAIYAFQQLASYARAPIEAYMEQEKASMKMGMAMKNQGDYSRAALADMEAYAEMIQQTTTVGDEAALSVMANLKSYGMTSEEVKRATKAALDLAAAKEQEGMTITQASELIGKSYLGVTGRLKQYGIVISESIPEGEKFAAVLDFINSKAGGSAQAQLQTYAGQWKFLQNQWSDVQEVLGIGLLKAIEGLLTGAGLIGVTFMTAGEAVLATLATITKPFTLLLQGFAKLAELAGLTQTADVLRSIASATDEAKNSVAAAKEGVLAWTSKQYDAMTATNKVSAAIEGMGAQGKRTLRDLSEEEANRAKEAAKTHQAEMKLAEEQKNTWRKIYEDIGKFEDDQEKEREAALKKFADETAATADANWKAWNKTVADIDKAESDLMKDIEDGYKTTMASIKKEADDRAKYEEKKASDRARFERDIYKDLRGYLKEYYDSSIKLIQSQADEYRKAGVDQVAVADWVAQEMEKAELRKLKASDNWRDGVKAAFIELQNRNTTWAETSYAVASTTFGALEKDLSQNFFNVLTGRFDEVGISWSSLWDSMARTVSNYLAQMATEWLMKGAAAGMDWLVDAFFGFGAGAWEVEKDRITKVHAGEMIIPKEIADLLRGGEPMTGEGWDESAPEGITGKVELSPEMAHAVTQAGQSFFTGLGINMGKNVVLGLLQTAAIVNPAPALTTIGILLGRSAYVGYNAYLDMATFRDIAELATNYGGWQNAYTSFRDIAELARDYSGGYGGYGGGFGGGLGDLGGFEGSAAGGYGESAGMGGAGEAGSGMSAGMGGAGETGSWKYGGISTGPEAGYWARLHGTEAVVPLPDGRSIPISGGADSPELAAELRKLREEFRAAMAEFRAAMTVIAKNAIVSSKILQRWEGDGLPEVRT